MPFPLTTREAAIELGCESWTCSECEQRFSAEPHYEGKYIFCPECKPVATVSGDAIERWLADGARVHDAVIAECNARICPDCGGDIEPAAEVMGVRVDGRHACVESASERKGEAA